MLALRAWGRLLLGWAAEKLGDVKLAFLVADDAHAGFFEVGLKPWDVAAGALIVREAGGVVMSFDGEDDVENRNTLIAAPYKLMTQLRKIIHTRWSVASVENS